MKLGIVPLLLSLAAVSAQQDPGPQLGEKVPAFQAQDQSGKMQSLESLKGPNGLYLLFVRSADW